MVEVTAPANMQEGYKFRAMYEGMQFPVIVVSAHDLKCHHDKKQCTAYGIVSY
jgi:hypothetical protein